MNPFHPTGGFREPCPEGGYHNWKFAYSGKACQISECSKCKQIKWKFHSGQNNYTQAEKDLEAYERRKSEFTLDAMTNLKVVYGDTEVAIGIFHKDGKYRFLVPNRDELCLSFVSRVNAFKHLIYILSMDSGLGGVVPK